MPEQLTSAPFDPAEYWEQRLSDRYSLGSTGWSSLGEAFNRWSYVARGVVFRRLIRDVLGDVDATRVLDVGSGTGFYLNQWRRMGVHDFTGSDLTSAAVEQLRQRFPGSEMHRLDIGDPRLPPVGAPYDAISAMDVLYHVVDDARYARALINLAKLLKPGGWLIFTENLVKVRHAGEHQVSRTEHDVRAALMDAGLVVVHERPMFFLMNTPVSSRSRLLYWWWNLLCRVVRRDERIGWVLGATRSRSR